MDTKKSLVVFAVSFVLVTLGALSWAGTGKVELPLMATKAHPEASGKAHMDDGSLSIEARGLEPDAVYTVWFVNMKPKKNEAGAGTAPYMFKTDSQGEGTYTSSLTESPFGKWQMVMIVLHPNGDPTDMKNMVGALSANIPKNK
jgi:hypothetical protein